MSDTNKDDYEGSRSWRDGILEASHYWTTSSHYWTTLDGRRLLPREMTTEHLRNILNMVMLRYQVRLLCAAARGNKHCLVLASSPENMRQTLLQRPILQEIENELVRRGM